VARALVRGVTAPDPQALRLVGSFPVERISVDVDRPGVFTLQGIVPAVRVRGFPASFDLTVVNFWTGGLPGSVYSAGVRIQAEDGTVVGQAETSFEGPGYGTHHVQMIAFSGTWDEPGHYTIETWLGGMPLYTQHLPVYEVLEDSSEEGAQEGGN
jgi:hypothetical protein